MRRVLFFTLIISIASLSVFCTLQNHDREEISTPSTPPFLDSNYQWVDSVFNSLTLDEKIGQLFMVAAYSNRDASHLTELENLVSNQKIGGLIFFQGGPARQIEMTNHLQSKAKTPLLIAIDAEWGLAMRLDSTIEYPKQMTLGAIEDESLIYQMGGEIASQCKSMGIHVNLAPVADVNNNPSNPVINFRSFGEDYEAVSRKAALYMNGLQDNNILATAKHFPGHGDTDSDSHKTLPIITHDVERLDSIELQPFKRLIHDGIGSIMTAHLYIPSLDPTPNRASTLSPKIVTDLLKHDLSFKGLTFTDALNMRGVSAFYDPGKLDVEALKAGNDVLLFSENVPMAIQEIKAAIGRNEISINEIDEHVIKILKTKAWAKVNTDTLNATNIVSEINKVEKQNFSRKLFGEAITLIKNEDQILPIKGLGTKEVYLVDYEKKNPTLKTSLDRYCNLKYAHVQKSNFTDFTSNLETSNEESIFILSINSVALKSPGNYGITTEVSELIAQLTSKGKVIVNFPGNPFALQHIENLEKVAAILVSYEKNQHAQDFAGQIIFGGAEAKGKLPISISPEYPLGTGIKTERIRLKYTNPEELGLNPKTLEKIDQIANESIKLGVFPGCQILAAKDGKVFYQKSFGFHQYDSSRAVENTDIYDLASITKIASSTASLMHLQSENKINVDSNLLYYLPELVDSTSYAPLTLKEMLTHQAGLTPWIPFYIRTLHKGKPKFELYSVKQSQYYDTRVAENLYITSTYRDSVFKKILATKVSPVKKYKYSDIGYYFINDIIRKHFNTTQDQFVDSVFYKPLGLSNIGYKPREKWDIDRIPPTENDKTFRRQLVKGDVHDQGAALLGGVCGHAGLFGSANDLAVMMQMMMQYGEYGGERYMSEEVVKLFTSSPYFQSNRNRRGIGFDKPVRAGGSGPTCSLCTSNESFGHSGFTGTLTWADPQTGLVYVFLSNRVYPDAMNRKIISMGVRTRIQQVLTDAVNEAKTKKGD